MVSAWALCDSRNTRQTPSLQSLPPWRTPLTRTLHPAHATRQGPLTARPWSIPPGVWGPLRSGTPAPPLHQPVPPPPGQPRLQAPQVGLAEKGLGGVVKNPQLLQSLPAQGLCLLTLPFSQPALVGSSPSPWPSSPGSAHPLRLHFVSHGPTAVTQLPARLSNDRPTAP